MKKAMSFILAVMMMCALCTTTSFAATPATQQTLTLSTDPAVIAEELMKSEAGEILVQSAGTSTNEKMQVRRIVQSYVDAVSTTSSTPNVKASIVKSGTDAEMTRFRLVADETTYTEEELAALSAAAGKTVQSINNFVCGKLEYDHEAANGPLTQTSTQATAKGALTTGKAICMGYANAFCVLAEQAGIQSIKVRGDMEDGEYHVVNMVLSGDELLVVDVTGNDSGNSARFLLITMEKYTEMTGFIPNIDVEVAFNLKYGADN